MCETSSWRLKLQPLNPTRIYTCEVIIGPRMYGGDLNQILITQFSTNFISNYISNVLILCPVSLNLNHF